MRELFDEFAGHGAIDPQEAARRNTRTPLRRRFYTKADVAEVDGGFAIVLDGKPVRTPSGKPLAGPVRAIADAMAEEWRAQKDDIHPITMPLTRLANTVIDAVADRADAVRDDIASYFGSDLVFYRAGHPDELVAREAEHWDPVIYWAADALGAHFILAQGIMHVRQPDEAIARAREALPREAWPLAALHVVTTITGSALLAMALWRGAIDADRVWAAAHVDENWNIEAWGEDEEVTQRRAARRRDFDAAAMVLRTFGDQG